MIQKDNTSYDGLKHHQVNNVSCIVTCFDILYKTDDYIWREKNWPFERCKITDLIINLLNVG